MVVCPSCHQTVPHLPYENISNSSSTCSLQMALPQATLWVPGGRMKTCDSPCDVTKHTHHPCEMMQFVCGSTFHGTPSPCCFHVVTPCQHLGLVNLPHVSCSVQSILHKQGRCTTILPHADVFDNALYMKQKQFIDKQWTSEDDRKIKAVTKASLENCGWYYGAMTSAQADSMLAKCAEGTFLIRDSSSSEGNYTLSIKTSKGPTSSRIEYELGKFFFSCNDKLKLVTPRFSSILKLIEYYVELGTNEKSISQVWVDNQGRAISPIMIKTPLRKETPSLQHLCRLTINKTETKDVSKLPVDVIQFLNSYPHKC